MLMLRMSDDGVEVMSRLTSSNYNENMAEIDDLRQMVKVHLKLGIIKSAKLAI